MNPLKNIDTKKVTPYLIGGGVLIGAYWLYKKLSKTASESAFAKDIKDITESSKEKPTFGESQYIGFADAIYDAMDCSTCWDGVDEPVIISIFKQMQNNLDVAKTINAFGTRKYWYFGSELTMLGWLGSELDSETKKIINTHLVSKGIKYRV